MINNQRGFITADFMFSIVVIFGLTAVLFSMTFTLTVASITQYITFAAARNFTVAHLTPELQRERALLKYQELVDNKVFAPLYKNGWFVIAKAPDVGNVSESIEGYKASGTDPNLFWGVGTQFTAKILEFEIPFIGSTNPDGDGSGNEFKTYMGSYLGREVTTDECVKFTERRWEFISSLSVQGGAPYSTAQGKYFPSTDNGC